MDKSFNFLLFSRVLRVKKSMPIPFPCSFWLVMWKCRTKQECLHIKNVKTSENEITQHSRTKFKTRGELATLHEAGEKKISEFKFLN